VIEKLDVRRAQVFVEALIVEVSADKAAEFGIQWTGINNINASDTQPRVFGTSNFGGAGQNILGIAANPTTVGRGLSIGIIKGQVSIGGIGTITNLGLLARALESHAKANILSTPNILTMDNEEARIVIGQNVPFITGQYAQSGAAAATTPVPFQTIERRDVGLTLRVRPQISEGGAIKLRIFQEVSSVQDSTNTAGIITNKRAIESTIVVDDGLIVAIGGLIEDRVTNSSEQIPLLGDLPLIGGLFRYDSRRQVKTNLMVFLRPVILRDARSYENVTFDRYEYLLREQKKGAPESRFELPDMTPQMMPDLKLQIDPALPRALPLEPPPQPAPLFGR